LNNASKGEKENGKGTQSLGLQSLPERTFEHDLAISDRYQQFSAELLRLGLLGISAIGFLITQFLLRTVSESDQAVKPITPLLNGFKCYVTSSLIFLGLSVACALLHRYVSSDSMSTQLELLRLEIRQNRNDGTETKKKRDGRNKGFKWSFWLLLGSGLFLVLGAAALIISMIKAMFS
jgi:hypothetical protein